MTPPDPITRGPRPALEPRRERRGNLSGPVLVTGGAGFIGANLADRLLSNGEKVRLLDSLARSGVQDNLHWLRQRHGNNFQHIEGDVRDRASVRAALEDCSFVFHLAAQVAVTTSLRQPLDDHEVNVYGTLNVLETIREMTPRPGLVFASTNKVYGSLPGVTVRDEERRCIPEDDNVRDAGIDEQYRLTFISPYGCSKGAADQYVLDYCRSFGLTATVLRMSCIYGPHQQANSDQGWVVHFLQTALANQRLIIYGNGRQVRDVLFIDDFIDALLAVRRCPRPLSGRAFNIGGGTSNSLSLLEMIQIAERLKGRPMDLHFTEPRRGDQPWFCADHRQFTGATGWRPRISPEEGIGRVWSWLMEARTEPAVQTLRHGEGRA